MELVGIQDGWEDWEESSRHNRIDEIPGNANISSWQEACTLGLGYSRKRRCVTRECLFVILPLKVVEA